jgi:SNF2 family DNA or RNA helicase
MQIVDNRGLLLRVRNPEKITAAIPKSRQLNANDVIVNWGVDESRVLKNLNVRDVPSPILGKYKWTGKYQPFDHQKTTSSFLTLNNRAFCFNEQGTGKTGSAIWASDFLMNEGLINRVLIICPISIMDSAWRADLFKFAMHRTVDIAHGSKKKRQEIINGEAEYIIINYDGVEIVKDDIEAGGFDLIIVDEATHYKNSQSKRWKVLNSILKPQTWLWMMTGTPAAQSPVDAYGLAKLVNPKNVPKFFGAFRDMVMFKATQFKWLPKPNAVDTVFNALQPAIRFTKDECLDLPDMTYVKREVELTAQQKKYSRRRTNICCKRRSSYEQTPTDILRGCVHRHWRDGGV